MAQSLTVAGEGLPRVSTSHVIDNSTPSFYNVNGVIVSSPIYNQLIAVGGNVNPTNTQAFLAWFNQLPTTLPANAGIFWNNGRTLAKS